MNSNYNRTLLSIAFSFVNEKMKSNVELLTISDEFILMIVDLNIKNE